jgi:hypothetical protein
LGFGLLFGLACAIVDLSPKGGGRKRIKQMFEKDEIQQALRFIESSANTLLDGALESNYTLFQVSDYQAAYSKIIDAIVAIGNQLDN